MLVRPYNPADAKALWMLYHDTTHQVNGCDYSREQCERWAPAQPDWEWWNEELTRSYTVVAESNKTLVGLAQLASDGDIGLFYSHCQWQGKGVGKLLFEALEGEARRLRLQELRASVSVTAKLFFLSRGFEIVKAQHNICLLYTSPSPRDS